MQKIYHADVAYVGITAYVRTHLYLCGVHSPSSIHCH